MEPTVNISLQCIVYVTNKICPAVKYKTLVNNRLNFA